MEEEIINLLVGGNAQRVRDFFRVWDERRNASFMDADREAGPRAASRGHIAQVRGQLRYHLGEVALGTSAAATGCGAIPIASQPPGGITMVARVGRFSLASLCLRERSAVPRRSVTRRLLSTPNDSLDPQTSLFENAPIRALTDLSYFGCVIAIPWRREPSIPAQLAFAVPNASISGWLTWIPLNRLHAILQERSDRDDPGKPDDSAIPDNAIPRFRLPKTEDKSDSGDK